MMNNKSNNLEEIRQSYLEMMKKVLTYYYWGEDFGPLYIHKYSFLKRTLFSSLMSYLAKQRIFLVRQKPYIREIREEGRDHPTLAYTMIGLKRLSNIQYCIEDIIANDISGDFIETGIWRGGAIIFMRAVLKSYGIKDRKVWGADSFQGLPKPDPKNYPFDVGDIHYQWKHLAVSLEQVKSNFEQFGLLDEQVCFLEGWFKDTLPQAPIQKIALLRLDGDMYESTMDALINLYPKVSTGGYIIVDDYGYIESCRKAVQDYRSKHNILDEIKTIDWSGVYWKKCD